MTDTLSRLRALLAEASLLPWGAVNGTREALKGWPIGFACGGDDDGDWAVSVFGRHASEGPTRGAGNDARLIAAAVNALPALLAVAEAAREHARKCEAEGNGGMNTVPTELVAALRALDEVKP